MLYHYPGYHGISSFCDLDVTILPYGAAFVVCSQDLDNTGTSVTNAAETIASQLCRERPALDPARLIWIERYPPRGSRHSPIAESFDLVTFQVTDSTRRTVARPTWKRLTAKEFQALKTAIVGPGSTTA